MIFVATSPLGNRLRRVFFSLKSDIFFDFEVGLRFFNILVLGSEFMNSVKILIESKLLHCSTIYIV